MSTKPAASYWVTEKGQRASSLIWSGLTALAMGLEVVPNSIAVHKFVNLVKMYKNGIEEPVSEDVLKTVDEVIDKCNIPEKKRKSLKFFTPIGFDVRHFGSTELNNGAFIGIPYSFRYKNVSDINVRSLLVEGNTFNFDSDTGRSLLSSLVLGENAKKFAIAREIYASNTNQPHFNGIISVLSMMAVYSISRFTNLKMKLHQGPRSVRLVLYSLASVIGMTTYCMLRDMTVVHYDKKADDLASNISEDYCKGGVEFYEKLMERNIGLREALGARGRARYTSYGNEEVFIRTKSMPLSNRLELMKLRLKELQNTKINVTKMT